MSVMGVPSEVYKKRKELGLCPKCGRRPATTGMLSCEKCRKLNNVKQNKSRKKLEQKRIANGMCPECGKRPPAEGLRICQQCRDYHAESVARRRTRRVRAGLCAYGGCENPPKGDALCCEYHANQSSERNNRRRMDRAAK